MSGPIFPIDLSKCFIVAEAEINHNGCFKTALEMIDTAKEVGADAVKFQYIVADEIATKDSPYYDIFKKVEFSEAQYHELIDYGKQKGIECFLTAPSLTTLYKLSDFKPKFIKIGSTNITNIPLLEAVGQIGIPVILSTGLAKISEIEIALEAMRSVPTCLLHCTVQYPAKMSDLNLRAIETMRSLFPNNIIGYSDHSEGEYASIVAITLGAKVIEKHFTLDRSQKGPDHAFSTDPEGFKQLILAIRNVEACLGDGIKRPSKTEMSMLKNARRYLVASNHIKKGEIFSMKNLDCRRVQYASGVIEPCFLKLLNGWKAPKDYKAGSQLNWNDFKEGT